MRGHVRRRGSNGNWAVVIDVPPGEDGKRRQRWHSGYRTRKDAQRALTTLLSRVEQGTYILPKRETLAEYLREWIEAQRAAVRPSTWDSYKMNIDAHIIPRIGHRPLQRLTAAELNALYADLRADGRRHGQGGLSPRSIRYIHTILHKALSDAVRWNRLARNVTGQADPPSPSEARSPMQRTWTAEELRAFLDHVRGDRLYAAWHLAATTGMRRGEVLGLRWGDLDLDRARLSVRQTLIAVRGKLSFSKPKTVKSRRSVALDETTAKALREHRVAQLEERLMLGLGNPTGDGLVFTGHPDRFSARFSQLVRDADLPRIRLHDLRHTHATLALSAGVHPKVVSERLGHATVSITLDTYSHAIPALQEEAAETVAALVFG